MRNIRLDAYKGLACIFVVFIHCCFPGVFGTVIKGIARFAVPLFFLISGYFTICNDKNLIWKVIGKKLKHIAILLAFSSLLWFLYVFVMSCFVGNKIPIVEFFKQFFAPNNFYTLIVFNNPSGFLGGGGVLWFMFALIYCYAIYGVIVKTNSYRIAYAFIPITLIINLLIEHGVIQLADEYNTMYVTNFWVFGYPLFMLGNLLRRIKEKNKEPKYIYIYIWIFCIIAGLVLSIVECLNWNAELYIGSILLSTGLLMFAIDKPNGGSIIRFLSYIGNKLSIIVYVIHYMVMVIMDKFIPNTFGWNGFTQSMVRPVIVLFVTVFIAFVFSYIKDVCGRKTSN
ncbi:MAG: acyltransferase [Acutalibacteraceae bacterium]|nr:acyltransferase [Acutalibacteraceae bacterium]